MTSFQGISTFITSTATVVSPTAPSSTDCCCHHVCHQQHIQTVPENATEKVHLTHLYTLTLEQPRQLVFLGSLFHVQVSGPVLIWRVPGSVLSAGTDAAAVLLHGLPHLQLGGFPSRCSPDARSNVPPHEGMLNDHL